MSSIYDSYIEFFGRHDQLTFFILVMTLLVLHLFVRKVAPATRATINVFMGLIALMGASSISIVASGTDIRSMLLVVLTISVGVFVLLSEVLQLGLAEWLTRRWKGNWTKVIEYIYLALGSVGVAGAVNRLDIVQDKIPSLDVFGPPILGAAIAIRFVKTRAEIGEWNKLPKKDADPAV